MPYVLGIDIGTTSTVAATTRPHQEPSPQLLTLGTRGAAVPSVLFLDPAGDVLVGEAAERRILSHPERVVREVKRRVGDTVPVSFGDVTVTPQDLFAAQARWVVDRAEEREGEPPAAVAVAVPATWGSYRTGLVRDALAGAGLTDVTLVSEPRAAARHYLSQARVADGATVAVYDFGGGTFDAAVLRKTGPDGCTILGRPEGLERLGGADLDELVLAHVAAAVGDGLVSLDPAAPGVLAALARLRRECTEAKEALSADAETTVPVLLPGLQAQVRLVRAELEELITPAVEETVAALAAALDAADVAPRDLEAILLVGGSSRIPLVAELLSERFDRPVAVDTDPQASVALGAARAAAEALARPAGATPLPTAAGATTGRGWTVAAGTITAGDGADEGSLQATSAATPDEAPARLAAVGSSFVPQPVPAPRRHVTGARVLAVSAAVLGITVLTSVAGQTPAVIEAGRSTLSSVVGKLGDSVQPDTPAAAAAEGDVPGTTPSPMATDASVFAGRRAQGQADASPSAGSSRPTEDGTTSGPDAPTGEAPKSTTAPAPKPSGTGGAAGPGTPAQPSPGTGTPATGTPGTGSPGTGTPGPTPTQPPDPTTPPSTQEPTEPPTSDPTTPPTPQEPTEPPTSDPTTPPAPQEPSEPPTSDPTTPPTTQEPPAPDPTTPSESATAGTTPGPTTGTGPGDDASPSPSAGGG